MLAVKMTVGVDKMYTKRLFLDLIVTLIYLWNLCKFRWLIFLCCICIGNNNRDWMYSTISKIESFPCARRSFAGRLRTRCENVRASCLKLEKYKLVFEKKMGLKNMA